MSQIPEGYARVTPYLLYADASLACRFLHEAFGFEELASERHVDASGRVTHSALKAIDQVFMLGSPGPEFEGPEKSGTTVHVYVYVPDADAHFERARSAGALIVAEPEDTPYGDRRYAASDTEGHVWWFATYRGDRSR